MDPSATTEKTAATNNSGPPQEAELKIKRTSNR
jgi:hypothetical protein